MVSVSFFYSIGSRYSYLASTQIDALQRDCGCAVQWIPLNSVVLMAERGMSPFGEDPISGQYVWTYREADAIRWARFYGAPYIEPRGRVEFEPQLVALAAVAANRVGHVVSYSHALFRAMFADSSITRIDRGECVRRAEMCGISASLFEIALDDPGTVEELASNTQNALLVGAFGVPTFVVGDELFWGNDRLVLLRHYLRGGGGA